MKKLISELQWRFIRTFKNKTLQKVNAGSFKVIFKKYWIDIKSPRDWWSLRLRADTFSAGYLFGTSKENLLAYITYLYAVSDGLLRDQGLADDIRKALNKYEKRLEKQAESAANEVTKEEEQRDARFLRESIEYGFMTKKQRKAEKKKLRDAVKEMVDGGEFDISEE
jgi:hypothetical protein